MARTPIVAPPTKRPSAPPAVRAPAVIAPSGAGAAPQFSPEVPKQGRVAVPNPMAQGTVPWSQATGTSAREKPEHFTPAAPPKTGPPPNA